MHLLVPAKRSSFPKEILARHLSNAIHQSLTRQSRSTLTTIDNEGHLLRSFLKNCLITHFNLPGAIMLLFVITAALSATSTRAAAQGIPIPDSSLQAALDKIEGSKLSLRAAEQSALKNSTSVRMAEASYLGARGAVRRERGTFDPSLFFSLNYQDTQMPTASFFSGAPTLHTKQTVSSSGVQMELPIGTKLQIALNTVRLETNSDFAFLNPEFDAFGSLSIRQPLLRGFAATARANLTQAKREFDAQSALYDQQVLSTVSDVDRGYWNLYAAQYDYGVSLLSRDRAKAFLQETETRAKAGLVGPNQVASARTFLAEQELLTIDSEENLDRQSDQFASLIGMRPQGGMTRFSTMDNPPGDFQIEPVDVLVERALQSNRDLEALKRLVEAREAQANAASWSSWPSVDLVGSVDGNGLSGTPHTVIFSGDTLVTNRNGKFTDAINQVVKRDFPGWSIGLEVNIPIGMRSGLGERDRLMAEVERARQQYIDESRAIENQVRESHRELSHAKDRLSAARDEVDAAQEQVRIGLIEFRNGRTTAFELVRLSEDLALAQRRYSEASVQTANAAVTLRQLVSDKSILTTLQ